MIPALLGAARLLGLGALIAEALTRTGGAALALFRRSRATGTELFGLGFPLGLAVLSMTFLGLALCGLFYPTVLVGAILVELGSAILSRPRPASVLAGAAAESGREGAVFAALALLPVLPHLLLLETEQDVFLYHLAMPWQFLQVHRAVLEGAPACWHMPLPVEMCFALPLILGDDRLAKAIGFLSFLSVAALLAGPGKRPPVRRWLAPILALSCGYVAWLMQRSKGDLVGAGWIVTGLMMNTRGAFSLGSVFLGMGVAAKLVYAPLVALWYLFVPPPSRHLGRIALGLTLALSPWLIKTLAVTGSPVFPMGALFFSAPGWDERNAAAGREHVSPLWEADTLRALDLPLAWLRLMAKDYLPVLLVLPGLLYLRATRMAAAACVLAQLAILGTGHLSRYVLPSAWFLAFLGGRAVSVLPARARGWASVILAATSVVLIVSRAEIGADIWRRALSDPKQDRELSLSTYGEAVRMTRELGAKRLLSVGEMRTYLLPGRVIYGGVFGETPVVWKMAREAETEARLRVKVRQLGAECLLFNYVSVDWLARRYEPFSWDDRMLGIYRDYARKHLTVLTHTRTSNFVHGGFYLVGIRRVPLAPAPETVWFLPGTETLYARMIVLERTNRKEGALAEALGVLRRTPDVGHAWNVVGHAYAQLNDAPNAYRYLSRFAAQGMVDAMNLWELGVVLVPLGRLDEAEALIEDATVRYPDQTETLHIHRALIRLQRARRLIQAGRLEESRALLDASLDLLAKGAGGAKPGLADARRKTYAAVKGLYGEYHLARNEREEAAAFFREAASIDPAGDMAGYWEQMAARLGSRTLSLGRTP